MNVNKSKEWLNEKFLNWQVETKKKQTVRSFAKYLLVKETSLSGWLNGMSTPEGENLRKIAEKLGTEIYTILGKEPPADLIVDSTTRAIVDLYNSLPPDYRASLYDPLKKIFEFINQHPDQALKTLTRLNEAINKITELSKKQNE